MTIPNTSLFTESNIVNFVEYINGLDIIFLTALSFSFLNRYTLLKPPTPKNSLTIETHELFLGFLVLFSDFLSGSGIGFGFRSGTIGGA